MNRLLFKNFILNVISTAIPLVILQLIILPLIGNQYGQDKYGVVIALIGIATLFSTSFGSVLNNVRLINYKKYQQNIVGDFNILMLIFMLINVIIVFVASIITIDSFNAFLLLSICLFSSLNLTKEYSMVEFRENLDYYKVLYSNLLLSFGYVTGYGLFVITNEWTLIYLVGFSFSLAYIFLKTEILKTGYRITHEFGIVLKQNIYLFVSTFLSESVAHVDKIMLLFVLGSSSVSIYYTATFAGKFLGLAVTPISAVLLSVFANMEKFNYMSFYKIVLFSMLIGFIGYFFILIISPYFINLLYPNWAAESIILISITSAISIVRIMNNIINPIILKFRNIKWQPVLKGLNFVLSIGLSFALLQLFGIKGFAIGILISSIVIWVLQVLVFIFSEENSEMELE